MIDQVHWNPRLVASKFAEGTVIPFLGAGVNLLTHPPREPSNVEEQSHDWFVGKYLPSGGDLSRYLANGLSIEDIDTNDLMRVSLYVDLAAGRGDLDGKLTGIFDRDYPTTSIHQFLATMPEVMKAQGKNMKPLIMITTNYDDVLENAFQAAGQEFDTICYRENGAEGIGLFYHYPHPYKETAPKTILDTNTYEVPFETRHLIIKIHGTVRRAAREENTFVITEDDYIRYMAKSHVSRLLPITLMEKLKQSSFLFLGYGLRDWNLRVLLYHLWSQRKSNQKLKSWAIQRDVKALEKALWEKIDVNLVKMDLNQFLVEMQDAINNLP